MAWSKFVKNSLVSGLIVLVIILASASWAQAYRGYFFSDYVPDPRLIEPIGDKVDLASKKELLFKWSPHEGMLHRRKYYDFRLYEGYSMYESTLILKKKVAPSQYQLSINADMFKDNQVYTWSLRQRYTSGKSRRVSSSFVVKR